jgi:hypothetical protein
MPMPPGFDALEDPNGCVDRFQLLAKMVKQPGKVCSAGAIAAFNEFSHRWGHLPETVGLMVGHAMAFAFVWRELKIIQHELQ